MNDIVVNKDEVVIRIEKENDTYRLTLIQHGRDDLPCILPVNKADYEKIMHRVYYELDQIRNARTYTETIDISENQCFEDLEKIVELDLFDELFGEKDFGRQDDVKICAKQLKDILSSEKSMRIRIELLTEFFFPWSLLYFGEHPYNERIEKRIEKYAFCGFKHTIEQTLMYKENGYNYDPIRTKEKIPGHFYVNRREISGKYIKVQEDLIDRLSSSSQIIPRDTKEKLFEDFSKKEIYDAVMYFFCHAEVFYGSGKQDPPSNKSYIRLTPSSIRKKYDNITLGKLNTLDLIKMPGTFKIGPLIFLNACESALIPPLFYQGFLSYFMRKGARGLVGTLCKIPTVFASKFGSMFLDSFMMGNKVDEIIRSLRYEFVSNHNNILGLYYSSYCDPGLYLENSSSGS